MCEFFSGVFDRQKGVCWLPGEDSHETILKHFEIPDTAYDPDRRNFVRFEITPPNKDVFEKDLSTWTFKIDERSTPSWWTSSCEESCWNALRRCLEECVFDGAEVDELVNRKGLWVRNTNIRNIRDTHIRGMYGSSKVGGMYGSSQVGGMYGSSHIRGMYGSSQVGEMRDSSQVGVMYDSSQVGGMRDSSQVGGMYGSSIRITKNGGKIQIFSPAAVIVGKHINP